MAMMVLRVMATIHFYWTIYRKRVPPPCGKIPSHRPVEMRWTIQQTNWRLFEKIDRSDANAMATIITSGCSHYSDLTSDKACYIKCFLHSSFVEHRHIYSLEIACEIACVCGDGEYGSCVRLLFHFGFLFSFLRDHFRKKLEPPTQLNSTQINSMNNNNLWCIGQTHEFAPPEIFKFK